MKKIYCICQIDPTTKEIIHCVTSDAPINDNAIPVDDTAIIYQTEKYEFLTSDNGMVRAREVIDNVEKLGVSDIKLKGGKEAMAGKFQKITKVVAF